MQPEINGSALEQAASAVEQMEKRQAYLKRAVASFKKGAKTDPCAIHRWIKANKELVEHEAPTLLKIAGEVEALCREAMLRFEADLREALTAAGYLISGQWPNYYVEHIVPVVIDEEKFLIIVGEERLSSFTSDAVVAGLRVQLRKLAIEPDRLKEFLRELYEAYKRLTGGKSESVAVWAIYREVVIGKQPRALWRDATTKNFRPFTGAEFRAHITAALKANETIISSHQLRLLPPISQSESLFIYQPAENRFAHVGRIQFIPLSGGEA